MLILCILFDWSNINGQDRKFYFSEVPTAKWPQGVAPRHSYQPSSEDEDFEDPEADDEEDEDDEEDQVTLAR
jgi:hypothetical protein